jgi:Protein of unknown function (DUF3990)
MTTPPVVNPPLPWSNQDIVLYHGTIHPFAASILDGVQVALGEPRKDFGPGFYTTTLREQAHGWASRIAARKGAVPAVVQITLSRDVLAGLQAMSFVSGDVDAADYWSFVHHCRRGALDHGRLGPQTNYDVVYGPLAVNWRYQLSFANADQVSFHTPAAEAALNSSARRRII